MARPEKVAAVEEIKGKLTSSNAAVLTEYRGLTVTEIARLRAALRDSGTTYTIYKNTLAIRAVQSAELGELTDLLVGPTAWAFVDGDIVGAAKAIRDFARTNDALVVKGGLLEGQIITAEQVTAIASLPSRDELLAKIAGVFKAPMYKTASLLSAIPRNMAYGLKALIDQRVAGGEELPAAEPEAPEAAADGEAVKDGTEGEASADAVDATVADEAAPAAEGADAPEAAAEDAGSPEPAAESGAEAKEAGAEAPEAATTTSEEDAADSGTSADESAEVVSPEAASDEAEEKPSAGESAGASE